jgi:tRNA A-37 threonylcarbamoyl transferase component Bud32
MNERRPPRPRRPSTRLPRSEDASFVPPPLDPLPGSDPGDRFSGVHDPDLETPSLVSDMIEEMETNVEDPFAPRPRVGGAARSPGTSAGIPLPSASSTVLGHRSRPHRIGGSSGDVGGTGAGPSTTPGASGRRTPPRRRGKTGVGQSSESLDEPTMVEPTDPRDRRLPSMPMPPTSLPVVKLPPRMARRPEPDGPVPEPADASEVTNQLRLPGLIDGRYQIVAPLGEGGMGRVLKVRHRALGKEFALKIVRAQLSDDWRAREAFFREARTMSSLAHPHIVTVTDFGVDPGFGAFIVMELLTGESLLVRIAREGRLPLKAACDIVLQIAEAVRFIHSHNIIHCDLKSENVYLYQPVAEPRRRNMVKLLDFGLSRAWHDASGTERAREKEIAGTPTYLAPERIEGRPPAPSNDIYALGVLFYEMLTGRPPFVGSISKVLDAHLDDEPVPPSKRLKEPLEERADEIILKALRKDPRQRQRDAAAFVYEVRTLMDMLGIQHKRRVASSAKGGAAATPPGLKAAAAPATPTTAAAPVAATPELAGQPYQDAFEACPLPLFTLGLAGELKLANRAFSRLLAVAPADLPRQTLASTLGRHSPHLVDDLKAVIAQGRPAQCQLDLLREGRRQRAILWLTPALQQGRVVAVHGVMYPVAMARPTPPKPPR